MSTLADIKVFCGSSHPELAHLICKRLGVPLGRSSVSKNDAGELMVRMYESVREHDVYIINTSCVTYGNDGQVISPNTSLMELLIMINACKTASARRVTAVIPHFFYARQDKKDKSRAPISARLIANMLETAGCDHVITMDLHASQIQGFFNIPTDHLYASPVFLDDVRRQFPDPQELVIVSPDAGGVERARAYSKRLNCGLAIIDKRRPQANQAQVMHIIGEIEGRTCVVVDDMIDTAGTLCKAGEALKDHGAARVVAYATHPILSGPAVDNITNSVLDEVVVTDTIPLADHARRSGKIRQLSVAGLIAEAIRRVSNEESVSAMFH